VVPAARGPRYLLEGALIVAFFLSYAGISVGNIVVLSLRQTITPGRLLGRMNAAMRTLMFGLGALGGPVAGVLAAVVGVHGSLWVSAAASVLVLVPIALSPGGRLREMPRAAAEVGAGRRGRCRRRRETNPPPRVDDRRNVSRTRV